VIGFGLEDRRRNQCAIKAFGGRPGPPRWCRLIIQGVLNTSAWSLLLSPQQARSQLLRTVGLAHL